jgi:hypothetical protein
MSSTGTETPIDKAKRWLKDEIWPDVHEMIRQDAYFRLWFKAHEMAKANVGPIAQTFMNCFVTAQVSAIRRLCDTRTDVISLPRVLHIIAREMPQAKSQTAKLVSRLEDESRHVASLVNSHVAHKGNPASPRWRDWELNSDHLHTTQKAICEVATHADRDLLNGPARMALVPVYQGDFMAELRALLPHEQHQELRDFYHEHCQKVDRWPNVAQLA